MAPPVVWTPSPERIANAEITRYREWLRETRGVDTASYGELWSWSVDHLEEFWASIWEFCGVQASQPYERVLGRREMPGAEWFPGARLSYVEHVFRGRDDGAVAIRHASELRELGEVTWGELRARAGAIARALRETGVGPGDRVCAYMPNIPETVAAFFATASIGAVWSSCAPEFGVRSVVDRFAQIEPKVLFAVDGYRYGGKDFDRGAALAAIQGELPTLERTFVLPYLAGGELDLPPGELEFAQLPFDHPLWVLYSSGTTGLPKAIVHSQGGILLEQLKKTRLHLDAKPGDRLFWFTTTGWMMWNFLVGGLLSEASIVLFDGNPAYPSLERLWDLAADAGVTCFGTSAGFVASCLKEGVKPRAGRDLSALDSVGSTGSPLAPEGFDWVRDELGEDVWLFSTSGGTDVCTAFVGGVPTLPVYRGELQARSLGAKVEAWSEDGEPLVGEVGELVITEPMPSMPIYLWDDPDGARYRDSYFTPWPGVWRHGDWIEITERGTAIITGRSDATINRGGVRMGTSELYRSVLALEQVVDALVVDVPQDDGGSRMTIFVVLREGAALDDELVAEVKRRIRDDCSPRHVPDEVVQVPEVPRTLSGKILEVPVKRILMGAPADRVASRDSLANPQALSFFEELARRPR
ncbi:MAG TPA: acetoacetate--CoA ligase [Gaiellaceae bacterium]|nr:acetoacetate--CoA ligase [Gaiellaceae bacterium]